LHSNHCSKIDVQLNNTMRIISGTLKCTQLQWLPSLCHITPSHIRRKAAYINTVKKCQINKNSILYDVLQELPNIRLKSRKLPWEWIENIELFNEKEAWKEEWSKFIHINKELVSDPTIKQDGFELRRKNWVTLNRFRTGLGKCNYLLHKWNMKDSPNCECREIQTMNHTVNECELSKYERIQNLNINV